MADDAQERRTHFEAERISNCPGPPWPHGNWQRGVRAIQNNDLEEILIDTLADSD
jgi:hypothetical protein